MKKIFLGAALATTMLVGCKDEGLVNSQESEMEKFTVEVSKGTDSRVTFDGTSAAWNEDDALYVYGKNGVRGTLYLTSGAGTGTATFTGVISGSKNDLTNAIFGNVKHEGDEITLTLSTVNAEQSNAPMAGEFAADKGSIDLKYICCMLPLTISDVPTDGNVALSGIGVGSLSYVNGKWVPGEGKDEIDLENFTAGKTLYIPYFTSSTETKMPLTVKVGEASYTYLATAKAGAMYVNEAPVLEYDADSESLEADDESKTTQPNLGVTNEEELRNALENNEQGQIFITKDFAVTPDFEINRYVKIYGYGYEISSNNNEVSDGVGKGVFKMTAGAYLNGVVFNAPNTQYDIVITAGGVVVEKCDFSTPTNESMVNNSGDQYGKRAIFTPEGVDDITGDLMVNECVFDDKVYAFNFKGANCKLKVAFGGCTIGGWLSGHGTTHTFDGCTFKKSGEYQNYIPYCETIFQNCTFEQDFAISLKKGSIYRFNNNCKYNGKVIEKPADMNWDFSGGTAGKGDNGISEIVYIMNKAWANEKTESESEPEWCEYVETKLEN